MFSIHDESAVLPLLPANGSRPLLWRRIERALYKDRVPGLAAIPGLPADIMERLLANCRHHELAVRESVDSASGETTRLLLQTTDGHLVESVIMRHPSGRNTLCLSSQAGCPMACTFCATGMLGLARDLTVWEIVDQVEHALDRLAADGQNLRNLVFMGMGEPFLNYPALSAAIRIFTAQTKYQFAHKKVTVSTCGLSDGIERFGRDHPLASLAVSLHAPDDATRNLLMPALADTPVSSLMASLDDYVEQTGRKVFYEYLMIDGLTDRDWQAEMLAGLLKGRVAQVNLIPWNPGESRLAYRPSPKDAIEAFRARLRQDSIPVTLRVTMGDDIAAACGQLASKRRA